MRIEERYVNKMFADPLGSFDATVTIPRDHGRDVNP